MNKKTNLLALLAVSLFVNAVSVAQVKPGPAPTPNPAPNPPPPPPAKKELDGRKLEEVVRAAAENFSKDVLELVGEAYQVRFNIREGLLTGKRRLGDYDNISVVRGATLYQANYSTGAVNGRNRGLEAGANHARSVGYNLADSDIGAAIDAAIENNTQIVLRPNPRMVPFNGLSSNLTSPSSMLSRIQAQQSTVRDQARRLLRSEVPSDIVNELFNMNSMYTEHRTQLPEEFKFDRAFENWKRDVFNTRDSRAEEFRRFYREIQDGNVYLRPQDNERAFRRGFLDYYARILNSPRGGWDDVIDANNNRAHDLGEDTYTDAATALASELGNYEGYIAEYTPATIQGFTPNLIPAYNAAYPSIVEDMKKGPRLTATDATLVASSGKAEVALGDTLDVIVKSVSNRGMVDGVVEVAVMTQGSVQSSGVVQKFDVKAISRDSQVKQYAQMARISSITGVDETITATVSVAGQNHSVSFKSSYEEKIRRLAQTQDVGIQKAILEKVTAQMKAQYDDLSGWGDQYEKRRPDMLLVRVLNLYKTLSEAEKTQLKTFKKQFRNVFGSRPGPFSTKRDEWDAAYAMLKEMGLN